ncbi:MAG: fibronectin type III domain-containing protein, partial [Thermoplasmata archaeon]
TIMWKTDEKAYSVVEYGETEELGLSEKNEGEFDEEHSVTLIDLIPDTTYYFRVVSTDGSNNTNQSITATFTTDDEPTEPPEIVGEPSAVSVTDTRATIEWKTNKPTNSVLSYGTDTTYAIDDIHEPTGQYYLDHSITITGLTSSTKYFYKIEYEDSEGNSDVYTGGTFITNGTPDITAPVITYGPEVIAVTDTTATIVWTTDEESDSTVEYGYNVDYGREASSPDNVKAHNITLEELDHSTTYHYRVISKDASYNENYVVSPDYTFTTKPRPDTKAPKILAGPTLLVTGEDTATVVWTTNEDSDSVINYGLDTDYGSTESDTTLTQDHEMILTGLTPSTTYHYMVRSSDSSGNSVESEDREFTTLGISVPIDIEFLNLANGDIVKDVITVDGRITGIEGLVISSLRYRVDNGTWLNLGTGSTFSIVIDTAALAEGEHTLVVEVTVEKLSKEVTMQEDITFFVEHETEDNGMVLIGIIVVICVIALLGAVMAVSSNARRRKMIASDAPAIEPTTGSPFTPMDFSTEELSIGFIPDEEPKEEVQGADISFIPDSEMQTDLGISFIPTTTTLTGEPGVSFIPDIEPVTFGVFEAGAESRLSELDEVRCPKCKKKFKADISSAIQCPYCDFSASLKR